MAVLPTPGSPISTGLFLVRRDSTCITRSTSFSRPTSGSSLPSRANWVRLRPNWSRTAEPPDAFGVALWCHRWRPGYPASLPAWPDIIWMTWVRTRAMSAPRSFEDLGGDAVTLAHQSEQHVLGADVGVAELQRFAK